MGKKFRISLFVFRRDLRLYDNTALNLALRHSERVLPCFIFDPRQIEPHPYQSRPALQFMLQSLLDLQRQFSQVGVTLPIWCGRPEIVIERAISQYRLDAVFANRDYTPFSRERDDAIRQVCRLKQIDFVTLGDALLTEPEQVLKSDQSPYHVFTAFYRQACKVSVQAPSSLDPGEFVPAVAGDEPFDFTPLITAANQSGIMGGREQAMLLLNRLDELEHYRDIRDFPALPGTSRLSPHLKFGTCSVREVFHAVQHCLGPDHALLRQLYWRDFFTHLAFHTPHVFGRAFHSHYDDLRWDNDRDLFRAWVEGRTGFPIVDAGMRELNATGTMHNRLRMITASFLVKDLHVDWRWGERYFAQHLIDYDPCVNNGNWQWAASTGCDAQPYFRIFNPWLQQQKFDPECRYIYRWIPELRGFSPGMIHQWYKHDGDSNYPPPIVDHRVESERTKQLFKQCR